jgi:hypothetical protein
MAQKYSMHQRFLMNCKGLSRSDSISNAHSASIAALALKEKIHATNSTNPLRSPREMKERRYAIQFISVFVRGFNLCFQWKKVIVH